MKAIAYLRSEHNSNNCISVYDDVQVVKLCETRDDCVFGGKAYANGCGSIIIDGDHLDDPVKVELIP